MRTILIVTLILVVISFAGIGAMYILDVMTWDRAVDTLLKTGGVIVFLGVCSALISLLLRQPEQGAED